MEIRNQGQAAVFRSGAQAQTIDAGLRAHMLQVYNWMVLGLVLTGAVAYAVYAVPALSQLFFKIAVIGNVPRLAGLTILGWVMVFAPLAVVLLFAFRIHKMSAATAHAVFWLYAGLVGISMSVILFRYTGVSIAKVFFITAASFAALSLYGYTTKRSLSGLGSFLIIGLFGVILASIVNIFLQSTMMSFILSIVCVLIFAGLTAYDTQKIKEEYLTLAETGDQELIKKSGITGALMLYIDFIGMFQNLMALLGDRE
jgi:hypothetical protein